LLGKGRGREERRMMMMRRRLRRMVAVKGRGL
jgi:hypothetical protein